MKIKQYRLIFELDRMWPPKPFYIRFCARIVSAMIINAPGETYQFGGWNGALKKSYKLVNADKFQLAHWILREAGYSCCPADVMRRAGVDPNRKL